MVSGGKIVQRRSPIDGVMFLFEPLRTLASAIVDYREGISSPRAGRRGVRVRAAAAVLRVRAVGRPATSSSCRCASTRRADEHCPLSHRAADAGLARRAARAGRGGPGRGRRSSPMSWRWGDRLVLVAAWIAGILAVPDRRRDRPLHGLPRHPVPAPEPDLQPPAGQRRPGRLGRLPRPAARDAAADADRDRARAAARARQRRVDHRVRAPELARARRRVEHRDRRRHARHRDRASSGWRSSSSRCSRRSRSPPKAAACTAARSSPPAR